MYRGIIDFKKGYRPRTEIVKDEKGVLVVDPTVFSLGEGIIWMYVGLMYIHTAESLVPEPSAFEFEMVIDKLKSHKSPGIDQIPAELIKAGGKTIRGEIHKLIFFCLE